MDEGGLLVDALGVKQAVALLLQKLLLALLQLVRIDIRDLKLQHFAAAKLFGFVARYLKQPLLCRTPIGVGLGVGLPFGVGMSVGIQQLTVRAFLQKALAVGLPMDADEHLRNGALDPLRHGLTVDARARSSVRRKLPLQHQRAVLTGKAHLKKSLADRGGKLLKERAH